MPSCYFARDARAAVAATTPAAVHTFVGLPPVMSQISAVKTSALAWIAAPGFDFASVIDEATESGVIPDSKRRSRSSRRSASTCRRSQ